MMEFYFRVPKYLCTPFICSSGSHLHGNILQKNLV